jgi:hypothetical protein
LAWLRRPYLNLPKGLRLLRESCRPNSGGRAHPKKERSFRPL